MPDDPTQLQGGDERRRAQRLSLERAQPPTRIPGYDPERFLGAGGYGEVWAAVDRNTGRRVAIKFYNQRGGLDWSLLAREVEKLAFLASDRYVVQLIEVGWDADPPYYVMEYVEGGSLQDRIDAGLLPVPQAVALFREVALALVHAHGKGVLHCDLKPANVLLDQDARPRLADFGQSRLAHEQAPALGTLFYMAPEQADLAAAPDAAWDVYALGALLYCMLTGAPPHRDAARLAEIEQIETLADRLGAYRQWIEQAPPALGHRQMSGVDRALADIVERCLAVDPRRRFANAQAVLDALDARSARRARRPLLVLGALGPGLLLLVMSVFAANLFSTAVTKSTAAVTARALESDGFAAQAYALAYGRGFEQRRRALEDVARDPEFQKLVAETASDPAFRELVAKLRDAKLPRAERERLAAEFTRQPLQQKLTQLLAHAELPAVASWFVTDLEGRQIARAPMVALDDLQIGAEFWKRDYFHGTGSHEITARLPMIDRTYRSRAFLSSTSKQLIAAVSTPIRTRPDGEKVGLLAVTLALGKFADFGRTASARVDDAATETAGKQMAVLVDSAPGAAEGQILEHPLLSEIHDLVDSLPPGLHQSIDQVVYEAGKARVDGRWLQGAKKESTSTEHYHDPAFAHLQQYRDPLFAAVRDYMAGQPAPERQGVEERLARIDAMLGAHAHHSGRWLAALEPVRAGGAVDPNWLVVVQEPYAQAVRPVDELRHELARLGIWAALFAAVALTALWGFVLLALYGGPNHWAVRLGRRVGLAPESFASGTPTSAR